MRKRVTDSQEYEKFAEETQARRVALLSADLYVRARKARTEARATRLWSGDVRAVSQEWHDQEEPKDDGATRKRVPKDDGATRKRVRKGRLSIRR